MTLPNYCQPEDIYRRLEYLAPYCRAQDASVGIYYDPSTQDHNWFMITSFYKNGSEMVAKKKKEKRGLPLRIRLSEDHPVDSVNEILKQQCEPLFVSFHDGLELAKKSRELNRVQAQFTQPVEEGALPMT